jgi:class 3 adenylate cyclase
MKTPIQQFTHWLGETFSSPADGEAVRIRKIAGALAQIVGVLFGLLWVGAYSALGYRLPAVIILAYILLAAGNLLVFRLTKNLAGYGNVTLALTFAMVFGLHIALGGFLQSGFVAVWAMMCPLSASLMLGRRSTLVWMSIFVAAASLSAAFDPEISRLAPRVPAAFSVINGVMNVLLVSLLIVATNLYLVARLDEARERADNLLMNVLPAPIAAKLKRNPCAIADGHDEVTVLFADIAGFTEMSTNVDPVDVVNMLNAIFSEFDRLAALHGLEKIKTIGDAYMAAGGLPSPRDDHAEAVVEMAFDMLDILKNHRGWNGEPIRVRIGINTGPVVAGVIGRQKFIYDLWGDAVNIASRMESSGMVDAIQVTENTYQKLRGRYQFEKRQPIQVKGKGQMVTYLLKGRINSAQA